MSKEHYYLLKTTNEPRFIKDGKYFRMNTSTFSINEFKEICKEDVENIKNEKVELFSYTNSWQKAFGLLALVLPYIATGLMFILVSIIILLPAENNQDVKIIISFWAFFYSIFLLMKDCLRIFKNIRSETHWFILLSIPTTLAVSMLYCTQYNSVLASIKEYLTDEGISMLAKIVGKSRICDVLTTLALTLQTFYFMHLHKRRCHPIYLELKNKILKKIKRCISNDKK